ncbi:MAG: RDD family protein [Clostridia bacterium]|nr:RDD family protein [Clostridia bacterium]
MNTATRRVLAFLIDLAIVSVVAILIVMMMDIGSLLSKAVRKVDSLLNGRIGSLPRESLIRGAIILFLLTFKDWIFFSGNSIGKQIMRIKVVKLDGSHLNLLDCIKRTLPYAILPVEAYFVLTEQDRLGDRWAHTTVVPANYVHQESEEEDDDDEEDEEEE